MKDSILTTKKKDMETFTGRMGENMREDGKMESSMESECTLLRVEKQSKENGRMEKDFNGLMNRDENIVFFRLNFSIIILYP